MKKILLLLLAAGWFHVSGQDTLKIEECYRLAEKNWPLGSQIGMISDNSTLRLKNLGKNFLPQMYLNGSASYQSAVTEVLIPLPAGLGPLDMPPLAKDWYKATLDVTQSIYDGNVTSYNKKLERFNAEMDQTGVKAELYKLKERVNQFYFSVILFDESRKILESSRDQVAAKLKEVSAAVANGAQLPMNADLLQAQLYKIRQSLEEVMADRDAALKMLAELISQPINGQAVLVLPSPVITSYAYENKRYEDQLFSMQQSRLEVMRNMVTTKWNPKFYAYGQAGYGRPGLNMLSNDFVPWGIIGAKVTWNFWNWNANKNEKKILGIQEQITQTQQSAYDKNLKIQSEKDLSEIVKAGKLLEQDTEIITLREKITKAASSQLDNGVITSSDYLDRLNEEMQARLSMQIHQIQLVKAKLTYLFNQGKL
jgi:outer membrane protein TolC